MGPRKTRGIKKKYTQDALSLDSDDDEPITVEDDQSEDADFDAQAESREEVEEDNDDVEDAEPSSDDDDDDDNDGDDADQGDNDGEAQEPTAQPKRVRNLRVSMIQSRKGFHDLPNYPLETRIVTRVYAGPLKRYARYSALREVMYGPEYNRIKIIWDLDNRWKDYPLLPPMYPPEDPRGITPSPWLPTGFEAKQQERAHKWYDEFREKCLEPQIADAVHPDHVTDNLPRAKHGLVTLVGPWDEQEEYKLNPGSGIALSPTGVPLSEPAGDGDGDDDQESNGWMVDVGGIPLAIAWAPLSNSDAQLLAVASIPFSDQEPIPPDAPDESEETRDFMGCIQLWEFVGRKPPHSLAVPTTAPPRLLTAKLFNWGRPKRIQWCPVPIETTDICGILAILCGDGKARVIEVKNSVSQEYLSSSEWITTPIATLGLSRDYNVSVTCLTWLNTNRIVLGHSDGTLTLWSIYPRQMLQRVGAHCNYIIDVCSGYPSNPSLIASIPVGGCTTLTDLSQPSSELTYFPVPAISFQPNLLCWNEIMQGFMALYPSSTPTTSVAFLHHRFFCQARSTITTSNAVTCVAAGASHPFVLVGSADGSVYACNALQKLFRQKGESLQKLKVFEHEYRPIEKPVSEEDAELPEFRGASRVLQGFLPEVNDDPRAEKRKEIDRKKKLARKEANKNKGRPRKKENAVDPDDREAEIDSKLASRAVTHEPLTRVTTISWNPNLYFTCWAACAMASGLIKVIDLGVE